MLGTEAGDDEPTSHDGSPTGRETPKYLWPQPTPEDREFWEGARRGELRIQRCTTCGLHQHYPRYAAARTAARDTRRVGDRERARDVYSFTVIRQNGVPPFKERVPFVVATVDLDEAGARMLAAMPALAPERRADRHAGAGRVPARGRRVRLRRLRPA